MGRRLRRGGHRSRPTTRGVSPARRRHRRSGRLDRLESAVPDLLPAAASHRQQSRSAAEALISLGREIGSPTVALDEALAADGRALPTRWGETVPAVERQTAVVLTELRGRVSQILGYLSTTLNSLREHGADPTDAILEIERMKNEVEPASVLALGPLLQRARSTAEDPIVAVVAGLLDEVRPKLVEARELGRDPSEVFASMNRAPRGTPAEDLQRGAGGERRGVRSGHPAHVRPRCRAGRGRGARPTPHSARVTLRVGGALPRLPGGGHVRPRPL